MNAVKNGDFVVVNFVGRVEETGEIFDLTDEEVAKKENIFQEGASYEPMPVVVGAGHVVKGLDKQLPGLKVGETKDILVESPDAFGRRDGRLMRLISLRIFLKRDIRPYPGMRINLQGAMARVQSVESGRVLVDFNHPLAGKKLKYTITVKGFLEKPEEKVAGLVKLHSGLKVDAKNVKIEGKKASVEVSEEPPDFVVKKIAEEAKKYADIQDVRFVKK